MTLKVAVLIPAAGASTRFGGKKKKQFSDLNGRAVFLRTIEIFGERPDVTQVIMAIPQDDEELFQIKYAANLGFFGVKYIIGGDSRDETILKLLDQINDDEIDLIALHDAVRPCITNEQIDAVFEAAAQTGAAILAKPIAGTVKEVDDQMTITKTVDRSKLWEAQTPQVFKPEVLRNAYKKRSELDFQPTDDAQLVEATGHPVQIVEGDSGNIKITTGTDIAIASAILKAKPDPKPSGPTGPWAAEQGW